MTKIFLLTAPFDEEAKTGDGQYAASLEMGFKEHYDTISCIWLKKEKGHYTIPFPAGTTSIPEETIPSALVLQPVANENTIISGYKLIDDLSSADEAQEVNNKTVSPRTPKIIVNHDDSLHSLTIMDIFSQKPVELDQTKVDAIISSLAIKKAKLEQAIEDNNEMLSKLRKPRVKIERLIELYKENEDNIQEHCSLNEYIEAHLAKQGFLSKLKKAQDNFVALQEHFTGSVNLNELEKLTEQFTGIKEFNYDFHSNNLSYETQDKTLKQYCGSEGLKGTIEKTIRKLEEFESIRAKVLELEPHTLIALDEAGIGLREKREAINAIFNDRYVGIYDKQTFITALLTADVAEQIRAYNELFANEKLYGVYNKRKLTASEGFHLAYEANRRDPIKPQVIKNIITSMEPIDEDTHLDIHIRPPDCGVFITPEDIKAFQDAGVKVNITIHEYKQNYTRRYLQQYTHDLMRQAGSVQFFNAMDRDNAIIASSYGDCDKRNTTDPTGVAKKEREVGIEVDLDKYPVEQYDLKGKSGLTVASQKLSTAPDHPEDVVAKEPNILSFGTIRPGKGFEEALKLAQLIKADESGISEKIQRVPVVKIAGDPQDKELMQKLVVERFGTEAVDTYQIRAPYDSRFSSSQRRDYWKNLVKELNRKVIAREAVCHNPYIDIHPWCEPHELLALKQSCKYVCRMDDMGMRNNGSAIISVLDVGIVYTNFGSVTDDIFVKGGQYGNAVDIGEYRYGKYSLLKKEEEFRAEHDESRPLPKWLSKNPNSSYKRQSESRDPKDILDSIVAREENQLTCQYVESSENYKTVLEAQKLLQERFTLKNAVEHLLSNIGLKALIVEEEVDELLEQIDPVQAQQESLIGGLGDIAIQRFDLVTASAIKVGLFSSNSNDSEKVQEGVKIDIIVK